MLQVQRIRENTEWVKERLAIKHFQSLHLLDELVLLDDQRKNTQKSLDDLLATSNIYSKQVGDFAGTYVKSGEC